MNKHGSGPYIKEKVVWLCETTPCRVYISLSTIAYLIVGIDKENYGFLNFHTSNNQLKTGFC